MSRDIKKQSKIDLLVCQKFMKIYSSADSRGIEFAMTFEEVKKLMYEKNCFFTGKKLNKIKNHPQSKTFDRIDNDKGYVDGNVVACSLEFNRLKKNLSIDQIKQMVDGFKKKNLW